MEQKLKHMEFLENVINRMNSNAFIIKGWAVTLISALFALAAKDAAFQFLYIAFIFLPVFWGLDAYYLSMEKQYRKVFETVVGKSETAIDFKMTLPENSSWGDYKTRWLYCLITKSVWPVYTGILLTSGLVYFILKCPSGQ